MTLKDEQADVQAMKAHLPKMLRKMEAALELPLDSSDANVCFPSSNAQS